MARAVVVTLLTILVCLVYVRFRRRQKRSVRSFTDALRLIQTDRWEPQQQEAFARTFGCQPVRKQLIGRWPWSLDVLKKQLDALSAQRLLAAIAPYMDKYGPTFSTHLFGVVGYVTLDPANLEAMYSTNFQDYGMGSRREGLLPFLGEGIFVQDGRAWKHSRELLRRQFARVQYQDLKTFEEHVETLVSRFTACNGVVDLQPAFFQFTLATTTALLFGESVSSMGEEVECNFAKNFDHASLVAALRLRLADHCWLYRPSSFRTSCSVVRHFANLFVKNALTCSEQHGESEARLRYPFILELWDELGDPSKVSDQLVNVLIAGRDTTACTLSWAFFLLVRHAQVFERLRCEIDSVVGDCKHVTRSHIRRLPYLKAVWDETLRLYPQIPVNVRIALKDTVLPRGGGPDGRQPLLVPKQTGVGNFTYHMHRRKDLYGDDADCFRPERWLGTELSQIGWGYMPFHGGPRTCLGKDFAQMEASYAIVRMIQSYPNMRLPPEIVPVPPGQEKQSMTIVVSSAEGCKVLLT